jgi:hypothetical protein
LQPNYLYVRLPVADQEQGQSFIYCIIMIHRCLIALLVLVALVQLAMASDLEDRASKSSIYKQSKTCCPGCSCTLSRPPFLKRSPNTLYSANFLDFPATCCCAKVKKVQTIYMTSTTVTTKTVVGKKAGKTARAMPSKQDKKLKRQEDDSFVDLAHLCKACPIGAKFTSSGQSNVQFCCVRSKASTTTTVTRTSTRTVITTVTGAKTTTTGTPAFTLVVAYEISDLDCNANTKDNVVAAQAAFLTQECPSCSVNSSVAPICLQTIMTVSTLVNGANAYSTICSIIGSITADGVGSPIGLYVADSASVSLTSIIGDSDPICLNKKHSLISK